MSADILVHRSRWYRRFCFADAREIMIVQKVVRAETQVLDAKGGRLQAVLSTEVEDRQGDIIRSEGWRLDNFLKHPVLLASHNYISLRAQIGEWESVEVRGKRLVGTARYYVAEGNEEADWAFNLASKGRAAYSVGFLPDMEKAVERELPGGRRGYEYKGQELLEVSQVTIPANPNALQLMVKNFALDPAVEEITQEMLEEGEKKKARKDMLEMAATVRECMEMLTEVADYLENEAKEAKAWSMKGAIPPHTTPKAPEDAEWDAGAEVKKAEGEAQLRRMHAWVDPEGDPENKGSYKLPHHRASGEVVWRGVAAAMAALLGARGGVAIPAGDKDGVYRHLVRHYKQFDKEPPEKALAVPTAELTALVREIILGRQ
jgi:hypothetical protein